MVIHYTAEEQEIDKQLAEASKNFAPKRGWKPFQDEMLRKHYGKVPKTMLVTLLHHSDHAVEIRASKLGVSKSNICR